MHGSRHLNAAEVCRAGFWETPQRGRGVGTTADAGVGGASSASPVSGATSGGNLKVSQVRASGLRLFGLNRVLNDRCLYSCPLSNTGLNCAGPLILQFFFPYSWPFLSTGIQGLCICGSNQPRIENTDFHLLVKSVDVKF